jgi:hypothetical protein
MGLQLSRWSSRRFGVLLLEQLYGNANVGKPAPDPLGHALLSKRRDEVGSLDGTSPGWTLAAGPR